ncbi:hypothetical protein Peur_064261 [Populus x canadensis]
MFYRKSMLQITIDICYSYSELKDTELVKNQLVLDLEDGLYSATESHICCTASYHELENMSYAVLPSVEFTSCLALLAEDQMNSLPNVMKMCLASCSVA